MIFGKIILYLLHLIKHKKQHKKCCFKKSVWVYSSKGQIAILGRIVSASGQIFRPDFRPQGEIIRPGMAIRPLDE